MRTRTLLCLYLSSVGVSLYFKCMKFSWDRYAIPTAVSCLSFCLSYHRVRLASFPASPPHARALKREERKGGSGILSRG